MLKVYHTLQLPFCNVDIVDLNGKVSSIEELPDFKLALQYSQRPEVGLRFYNQDPYLFTDTAMHQRGMHSAIADRIDAAQGLLVEGLKYAFAIARRTGLAEALGQRVAMLPLSATAIRAMWESGFTEPDVHSRVFWSNEVEDLDKYPRLRLELGKGVSFVTYPLDHKAPTSIRENGIHVGYNWFGAEVNAYVTRMGNYRLFQQFLTPQVLQEAYLKAVAPIVKHIGSAANPAMQLEFNPNVFLKNETKGMTRFSNELSQDTTSTSVKAVSSVALGVHFSVSLDQRNVNKLNIIRQQLPSDSNVMKYYVADADNQVSVSVDSSAVEEGTWVISFYTLSGLLEVDYGIATNNLAQSLRPYIGNDEHMGGITFTHVVNPARSAKVAELATKLVLDFLTTKKLPDTVAVYDANVDLFEDINADKELTDAEKDAADDKIWDSFLTMVEKEFRNHEAIMPDDGTVKLAITRPETPVPDEPSLRFVTVDNSMSSVTSYPWVSVETNAEKGKMFVYLYKDERLCKLDHKVLKYPSAEQDTKDMRRVVEDAFCLSYSLNESPEFVELIKEEAAKILVDYLLTARFPVNPTYGRFMNRK